MDKAFRLLVGALIVAGIAGGVVIAMGAAAVSAVLEEYL